MEPYIRLAAATMVDVCMLYYYGTCHVYDVLVLDIA